MAEFRYQAKKVGETKLHQGEIEAENSNEAAKRLKEDGFIILKITPAGEKGGLHFHFQRKGVPLKEKIIFTRQLSVMTRAGLPIVKAMEALRRQTQHKYFQHVIDQLVLEVKGGRRLSQVMAKYPKVFPEVYVAVVRAGEESGQLSDVLLNLADQQEKDADLIGKIKGAMIYPVIILITLVAVGALIIFFVLPSLQAIFADSGQKLPVLTRILLGTSYIARKYFLIIAPVLVGMFLALRFWVQTVRGRAIYDHLKITLPVFGSLTKKVYMARFSRTMAILIKASLPILQSIKIVKKTVNNTGYNEAFTRIERGVESGKSLSSVITKEPLFPPMVAQLTNLGEETGNLEGVLLEIASFYDKEVDTVSKNLTTLLEPLLMIVMGIGVGFIVAAVLGPIYGLVQNFWSLRADSVS